MNVQILQLAPIPVAMLRHRGPYDELSPKFDQLWNWVESRGVPAQRTLGLYWDNPDFVAAHRLRSAACVEVPASFQLSGVGGLQVELSQIEGGEYATTRYVGPYENLAPIWSALTQHVEGVLTRTIGQNPAFEVYVNAPSDTPAQRLITDLYMPVL